MAFLTPLLVQRVFPLYLISQYMVSGLLVWFFFLTKSLRKYFFCSWSPLFYKVYTPIPNSLEDWPMSMFPICLYLSNTLFLLWASLPLLSSLMSSHFNWKTFLIWVLLPRRRRKTKLCNVYCKKFSDSSSCFPPLSHLQSILHYVLR